MKTDENVVYGTLTVRLFDENGYLKHEQICKNLITDVGDYYQCLRIAAGINSNAVSQPTPVTGMKLGTSTTAPAKSGAGAALVSYLTGSNKTFDDSYPLAIDLGAGLGSNVVYRCTWGAGVATSATINEIVIVRDAGTNLTSSVGNTIARSVFGATINKASGEALEVTWNHKQLGA